MIGNERVRERIESMRIGDRIDSDHHPVEVVIKARGRGEKKEQRRRREKEWRGIWDGEERKEFRKKLGRI